MTITASTTAGWRRKSWCLDDKRAATTRTGRAQHDPYPYCCALMLLAGRLKISQIVVFFWVAINEAPRGPRLSLMRGKRWRIKVTIASTILARSTPVLLQIISWRWFSSPTPMQVPVRSARSQLALPWADMPRNAIRTSLKFVSSMHIGPTTINAVWYLSRKGFKIRKLDQKVFSTCFSIFCFLNWTRKSVFYVLSFLFFYWTRKSVFYVLSLLFFNWTRKSVFYERAFFSFR